VADPVTFLEVKAILVGAEICGSKLAPPFEQFGQFYNAVKYDCGICIILVGMVLLLIVPCGTVWYNSIMSVCITVAAATCCGPSNCTAAATEVTLTLLQCRELLMT